MTKKENHMTKIKEHESSVLNRAEVKRRLLAHAANRAHKFTRVSEDTLTTFEAKVEAMLRAHVADAPSRGVTL